MVDAATRIGLIGTTPIRLAAWLDQDERYQRRYIPVDPSAEAIASDRPGLSADPRVRTWAIRSWAGGEGDTVWDREISSYRKGDGLAPVRIGDGLQLVRNFAYSLNSGGTDFSDAKRFGYGLGSLWAITDNNGYSWDRTNGRWAAGIATGAAGSDATSITDGDDTFMWVGLESGAIRRFNSGGNAERFAAGTFAYAPVLRSFQGLLYALDGDDLYTINKTVVNTRVQVADLTGSSDAYLDNIPWSYNRMSLSDKGPIWIQRLDNGQTFIWEYNVALDTQQVIGTLPVDFAYPYSVFYSRGFTFVGFRYANGHDQPGDAAVYFFRGAQNGVAPLRLPEDHASTANLPVLIAGFIGDDLMIYYAGRLWAYNVSAGGIHCVGIQSVTSEVAEDAITFGHDVFAGDLGGSRKAGRWRGDRYAAAGSLSTGRFDFDYEGLLKLLLEVTVITDPLPASTSVTMQVAADGGTPVTLTGTHDTDGQRRFTWFASSAASSIFGYEFELIPNAATSDTQNTPTIRQVAARGTGAVHQLEFVLSIDVSDMSAAEIDGLNALADDSIGVLTFTDPFQNPEQDAPDTFAVTVEEVVTPEVRTGESPTEQHATIRMRGANLVGLAAGGS